MIEIHYNSETKMQKGFPKIKKLGAVSPNGESTPFVFNGKAYRLELCDATGGTDYSNCATAIIRDRDSGEIISRFGEGCYYYSFYQENGINYVLGTKSGEGTLSGSEIILFQSCDLINWKSRSLVSREGWQFFNTALTKGEEGYVLLLEFGPYPFSYTFAKSKDLLNWEFLSDEYIFGKDRYVGGPFMRYCDGFYYVIAVTELIGAKYTNYIYRTKDFLAWEAGFYNPLFMPDENDRKISSRAFDLSEELLNKIPTAFISSNADVDMCDLNGKTLFTYNVGNQLGFYYLAEAECDGTVEEFLKNNFK